MRKTLIDGNSIGYAAHQGMKLTAGDQSTQAIFGTIKTVRTIVARRTDARNIVLWDGRSWRKDVLPDYKAQRSDTKAKRDDKADYKEQAQHIRSILHTLGISQVVAGNLEADDLASILSKRFEKQGHKVRLITRDKDWLQLVSENVLWHDHMTDELIGPEQFKDKTGYDTTTAFVQHKALTGDTSDNIKGVGGIGDVAARNLFSNWPDVESFIADPDREEKWCARVGVKTCPKAVRELATDPEKYAAFRKNMRLMDLRSGLPEPENLRMQKGELDRDAFRKHCIQFGFHSILDDFDRFFEPFVNL